MSIVLGMCSAVAFAYYSKSVINIRSKSSQALFGLRRLFCCKIALLRCDSFQKKDHAQLFCAVVNALTTKSFRYQPFSNKSVINTRTTEKTTPAGYGLPEKRVEELTVCDITDVKKSSGYSLLFSDSFFARSLVSIVLRNTTNLWNGNSVARFRTMLIAVTRYSFQCSLSVR